MDILQHRREGIATGLQRCYVCWQHRKHQSVCTVHFSQTGYISITKCDLSIPVDEWLSVMSTVTVSITVLSKSSGFPIMMYWEDMYSICPVSSGSSGIVSNGFSISTPNVSRYSAIFGQAFLISRIQLQQYTQSHKASTVKLL